MPTRSVTNAPRLLVALAFALAAPWSVQVLPGPSFFLVFPWGLASLDPLSVTTLPEFLLARTLGLPGWILAWPTGVAFFLLAVVSAVVGTLSGREDSRLTAGLLVLAGVTPVSLAWGFSAQPGRLAVPVGTIVLWAVAWWHYDVTGGSDRDASG